MRAQRNDQLLSRMSNSLWGETSYVVAKRSLQRIYYLAHPDVEPEFLLTIATRLKLFVYSRLEPITCANLTVVQRGVAAKKGNIIVAGGCFGSDIILSNAELRDKMDAIALTFTQVRRGACVGEELVGSRGDKGSL